MMILQLSANLFSAAWQINFTMIIITVDVKTNQHLPKILKTNKIVLN